MFHIAETHDNISHPHTIKILNNFQGYTKGTLQKLVDKHYVTLKRKKVELNGRRL